MRAATVIVLLFCVVLCSEALAGLGEPLSRDSLTPVERRELLDKVERSELVRGIGEKIGKEKVATAIERLPDTELKLLAENAELYGAGSTTLAEFFVQLVLVVAVVGLLIILLIVLGVVALFAGAAGSTGGSTPMGKAQYEEQRKKLEETKKMTEPPK